MMGLCILYQGFRLKLMDSQLLLQVGKQLIIIIQKQSSRLFQEQYQIFSSLPIPSQIVEIFLNQKINLFGYLKIKIIRTLSSFCEFQRISKCISYYCNFHLCHLRYTKIANLSDHCCFQPSSHIRMIHSSCKKSYYFRTYSAINSSKLKENYLLIVVKLTVQKILITFWSFHLLRRKFKILQTIQRLKEAQSRGYKYYY